MADIKNQDVEVTCAWEKEAVAFSSNHELVLLTTIKGPIVENETRDSRAPIDLVAVIDRSGSMAGDKLELVLKTMDFVVDQLKENDQLCIISYDTEVVVSLPFTAMNTQGKKLATTSVSQIKAGSLTNLSGGLLKGIEHMMCRTNKNNVASIMLFTDGQANAGLTKTAEIVKAIEVNLEKVESACSIFSFGFGADHDEVMLREIAEAGKGLYYFIETLDDIPRSFGDCLGGLLTVAAQNITLQLDGVSGITLKSLISKIKGAEKSAGANVEINLGDIYSEETRDIAAIFKIPAIAAPNEEFFPAVNITISYFNVHTSSITKKQTTAYLKRPLETPADQPVNMYIDKQRNRLLAAEAMEQATKLKSDPASREKAQTILKDTMKNMKKSTSVNENFTKALLADISTSLSELQDESYDHSACKKKMQQKATAHSRQRGHGTSDMYDNESKTQMKSKANYVSIDWAASKSNNSSSSNNNNTSSSNNNNNTQQ